MQERQTMKHIHILGICGTFMGSLALLARAKGFRVTGSDENVYPPMSTQLEQAGIVLTKGYKGEDLDYADLIVVGNAMSRGNPAIEYMLNKQLHYQSGPEFLAEHILSDKWVLAVAGTHGKTTTSTMLAWILEQAGMSPGFLIGGVPLDFDMSARLGNTPFFVLEADEYDTAFFDKRSKFIHYHPRTLILNNLEFDHADIFDNLASIQKQFHHLIKTIPSEGKIIAPKNDTALSETLNKGCWTPIEWFGPTSQWKIETLNPDGSHFEIIHKEKVAGTIKWQHTGKHNMLNALSAILAARHVGVTVDIACKALCQFNGIKRRMELLAEINNTRIYDDFAHHPSAIELTLAGWRKHIKNDRRIRVVIEPGSNTMKQGIHQKTLGKAVSEADEVVWFEPKGLNWSLESIKTCSSIRSGVFSSTQSIIDYLTKTATPEDDIIIMSNSGFNGLHQSLIESMKNCMVTV